MITVGLDEVGRGCWAGPVVAAAVALEKPLKGLKDSKKLSKRCREELAAEIEIEALALGIGWVEAAVIDEVGINTAVKMAMQQAMQQAAALYDEIIVDGHINYLDEYARSKAVIKADDTVPAVSAASIVAKVARDRFMAEQAAEYPGYGFESHVGYGTAAHVAGLKALGICRLHRKSYKPIKAFLAAAAEPLQ